MWRTRRSLTRDAGWDSVIARMAPMPMQDGLYSPVASEPGFWTRTSSRLCRGDARAGCGNRDHPSFPISYGLIASDRVDPATMARTLAVTTRLLRDAPNYCWARPA